MTADVVTHYVLDAVILVLATIRYLWGTPADFTRLGIMAGFFELSVANIDSYYRIFTTEFEPGGPAPRILGKLLIALGLITDLIRDYVMGPKRRDESRWARRRKAR